MSVTKDTVSLLLGALGSLLGLINTCFVLLQRRTKLKVKASYAKDGGHFYLSGQSYGDMVCVEVTNLSNFPVYISEAGFTIPGTKRRMVIAQPITTDHNKFSRELNAGQSVSGYSRDNAVRLSTGRAYVTLANGRTFYGSCL